MLTRTRALKRGAPGRALRYPTQAIARDAAEIDILRRRLGPTCFSALAPDALAEFVTGFAAEFYALLSLSGTIGAKKRQSGAQRQLPVREAVQRYHHVS